MSHEHTQGLLMPCPTAQPPSRVTQSWHGRGTQDLEGERCFAASSRVRGEKVLAVKQQSAPITQEQKAAKLSLNSLSQETVARQV